MKENQGRECSYPDPDLRPRERSNRKFPGICKVAMKECAANHGAHKKRYEHQRKRVGGATNRDRQQACPRNLIGKGSTTDNRKQKKQEARCGSLRSVTIGRHSRGRFFSVWRATDPLHDPECDQTRERINSDSARDGETQAPCGKQDKSRNQGPENRP